MRHFALGLLVILPSLAGCSFIDPYVVPSARAVCIDAVAVSGCEMLSATNAAVIYAGTKATEVQRKLNETTWTSRSLDVATFGLVSAFAVKAAHGSAAAAGAKNLALGAGGSFTAGRIFFPVATEELYMTAHDALICVGDRGNGLLGVFDQATRHLRELEITKEKAATPECRNKLGPDRVDDFSRAYLKASALREAIQAADATIHAKLTIAVNRILAALRKQLREQRPDPNAILSAGANSAQIAAGIILKATPSPSVPTALAAPQPSGFVPACEIDADVLRSNVEAANAAYVSLAAAYNAIGDLTEGCAVAELALEVLTVSQSAVTLAPGTTFNLVYQGGRPPIHVEWTDDVPKAEQLGLTLLPGSSMLQLSRPPNGGTGTGATFKLLVFDSAIVRSSVEVGVTLTAQ